MIVIGIDPVGERGTTNVLANPPLALVVPEETVVEPFHVTAKLESASKPVPESSTDAPDDPFDGDIENPGITEKVAFELALPWSTVIVCGPAGAGGTVKEQVKFA